MSSKTPASCVKNVTQNAMSKQNGKIFRSAKFSQCHNVGTLIQCDAFVDCFQETGECEMCITNSGLGT